MHAHACWAACAGAQQHQHRVQGTDMLMGHCPSVSCKHILLQRGSSMVPCFTWRVLSVLMRVCCCATCLHAAQRLVHVMNPPYWSSVLRARRGSCAWKSMHTIARRGSSAWKSMHTMYTSRVSEALYRATLHVPACVSSPVHVFMDDFMPCNMDALSVMQESCTCLRSCSWVGFSSCTRVVAVGLLLQPDGTCMPCLCWLLMSAAVSLHCHLCCTLSVCKASVTAVNLG